MDDYSSLRVCCDCGCSICFESAAEPLTFGCWLVVVQCPNCWNSWSAKVNDRVLERFERALDDDTAIIEAEVEELAGDLARTNAEELASEIARFSAALEADAILPMDF
jgi:hypothetical protein